MFKGTYSQEQYQEALNKAKAIGIAEPSPATSFNITNKKNDTLVVTGEFQLNLAKTVNGLAPKAGETFEFSATAEGDNAADAPAFENVATAEDGTAAFATAKLSDKDAGKTYTYRIHEVTVAAQGWTNAPDVIATVMVGMPADTGVLTADVSYRLDADGAEAYVGAAQFDNAYQAKSATATFAVDKVVNGEKSDGVNEAFTFELKAASADAPMPEGGSTMTVTGTGAAQFGSIAFSKAGVYKYVIHETTDLGTGWANDADVNVTVEVTVDDATRDLVAKVDYDRAIADGSAAAFNDLHVADGKTVIAVSKTVNGSSTVKPNETFEFALYQADADGKATGEQLGRTVSVASGGTATFDELTFNQVGTYAYVVHEIGHDGNGWTAHDDVVVTVSVEMDPATNRLVATVNYGPDKSAAEFNDLYEATGSATISVAKTVNGAAPEADQEFDFELRAVTEGAPMPEDNTATTVGAALASFGRIEFGLADAGKTYEYLIHEATPATVGWTMAGDVAATVTVGADNGDGTLAPCAVTYSAATQDSQAALFNNLYRQATGEFQLGLVKTVNGAAPLAGETFEFSATSADEGAPAFENVTTGEDGSAAFAVAKLSDKDMGKTYTYTIHEVTELTEGAGTWTKAADVTATVVVSERNDDNTLTATVSYSDGSATAAKFDNAYEAQKATATVKVDKTVNGAKNAEENAQFTFALLDKNNEQVGGEITVDGTGTAEFGELVFDAPGTYEYAVHETSDLGDGWFNAGDVKATVAVDYAENGRDLVAKVTYDGSSVDAAQFDNVHAAPATADLKVTKTVNGEPLQPHEQFTFTLLDKDGNQLGDEITIKGSDAKPEAVFDQLTFDKVGTYEFTIHETSDLGDGWTNDGDVKVTVTVTRDEATKTLKAEVVYDRSDIDGTAAQFDNKHEACGSADIAVAKLVNGAAPAADQKFDFALSANDDASAAKMPAQTTATTVGSTVASFGSVDFTLADAGKTFSYTIHETTPAAEGWTNAPDVTVTLTVGDDNDGDGKLPVTVEYSTATADGTAALFNNAYKPVVPEKPSVPKTGDETPVEAMTLTAAAGVTLAATGLFLGLRSRKRDEQL